MQTAQRIIMTSLAVLLCSGLKAGTDGGYEVFIPIAKYISLGDADKLSAWFADNLEITIMSQTNDSSKNQARQILKTFFSKHTPRTFEISHTASMSNSKYALGYLNAGGEVFQVTIFVSNQKNSYKIQQLKIDRIR